MESNRLDRVRAILKEEGILPIFLGYIIIPHIRKNTLNDFFYFPVQGIS
jgi:hypothetical protein